MTTLAPPPPIKTKTPAQELAELEQEVLSLGMNLNILEIIRAVGDCLGQVRARISALQIWIDKTVQ